MCVEGARAETRLLWTLAPAEDTTVSERAFGTRPRAGVEPDLWVKVAAS